MFTDETFLRLVVPFFPDSSLWEGMLNTTLLHMMQLTCTAWGAAGILLSVHALAGHHSTVRSRNP
jgi:hypothetical protein